MISVLLRLLVSHAVTVYNHLIRKKYYHTLVGTFNDVFEKINEIMKRSRLNNKANKSCKQKDKRIYNIQWNKVSKLNNKIKKTYFKEKLPKGNNVKDLWNYCNSFFTNKGICNNDRIILVENDEILNKDFDIFETFNNCFVTITKDFEIFDRADDSLGRSIFFAQTSSFSNHSSIQIIKG